MRKVTGKKKDATNGEDDGSEIQDQESVGENGEPEDPLSGTDEQNGDADAKDGADSETADEDDLPLKEAVKKTKKGGKSKKKSGKKGKKEKKRVTIDAPEDDGTGDDSAEEADEEYEVADIVAHKYIGKKLYYQIRWKGYTADDDTWEPKDSLSCPEIIKSYEAKNDVSQSGKGGKRGRGRPGKGDAPAKKTKKARDESEEEDEEGDPDKEYEVQRIIDVRKKKNGTREFLVHWKGWSSRFDSWEPEDNLNCDDLIQAFDSKLSKAKNTSQKDLRIAPKATKHYTSSNRRAGGVRASKRAGAKERVTYFDAD